MTKAKKTAKKKDPKVTSRTTRRAKAKETLKSAEAIREAQLAKIA